MANSTFYGVEATKVAANIPSRAEQGKKQGKIVQMYDTYVLTADLASGDTIKMGELIPEGARFNDCRITSGALGGSCTIDVGWQASADGVEVARLTGIFSALPVSSATVATCRGSTYEGAYAFQKTFAAPVQPVITEHAVSSGATGLALTMELTYIVD